MSCPGTTHRSGSYRRLITAGILPWLLAVTSAQTLYDAASGSLPAQQGWGYAAFPGQATQTLEADAVRLNTWSTTVEQAGYGRAAPIPLDRTVGFTVRFTVRLLQESHGSPDRAGFSVIVLGHDRRGIELGFWPNGVFAQADQPLFTHAEEAAFDTAGGFVDYALTVGPDRYQLRANGGTILGGPVRDYTAFSGVIDPYETPDFIFLGDDTTSARAVVSISRVVLIPPPTLRIARGGVITWTGVTNVPYTILTGHDRFGWSAAATLISTTGQFAFTNAPGTGASFLRVAGP
jgi:hypothetical protein